VSRLHDDLGISARHITISTVGIIPGIRRLAAEDLPVNLAVSLHAANDELRNELVPINRRYPIADLLEACRSYLDAKGRRLSFEWALIAGVNDRATDALELAELARPLGAHINLIPLNPTAGYDGAPTDREAAYRFQKILREYGLPSTVRQRRGIDIAAGCGQLASAR
ncbi:MAG: 23S rRNA (adenine(2503)-C(2))-methyltransferase RlmN, partial [Oleiharenicola lentus]